MNDLCRRIKRLEKQPDMKQGPRLIYIMPNLEDGEREDTPYFVRISSEKWAHASGGTFTADEIRALREEYGDERSGNEPETTA